MTTFMQIIKISHSEDLEEKMRMQIEYHLASLGMKNPRAEVYASMVSARTDFRRPMYEFHLMIKSANFRKKIFIKKSGQEFWATFSNCIKLCRNQIAKEIARQNSARTKRSL